MVASAIKSLRTTPLSELLRQPPNRQVTTFAVTLYFNSEPQSAVNVLLGLVVVILTMKMILLTSAAIVRERERDNMEMLIYTLIKSIELMVSKIIPYVFLGLTQFAIILGLGRVLFDVQINGGLGMLPIVTLRFIFASLSLGLVICTLAKKTNYRRRRCQSLSSCHRSLCRALCSPSTVCRNPSRCLLRS